MSSGELRPSALMSTSAANPAEAGGSDRAAVWRAVPPAAPAQADAALAETAAPALSGRWWFEFFLHLTFATPNPLRTHPDIAPSRSSESRFRSDRKQS